MPSFGPSTYHTARYTIQGCDCMSMQQLSRNNFSMLLPTFFIFWGTIFGSHFRALFLLPLTILREKLIGARGYRFKNGPPFLGPKNCIIFDFFFAKTLFFTWAKTCTCWLSKQPFCTNMHKNLPGIELRWHEGKIMKILGLTSGTAPSQKLVRN